jgi:hypothetical protein
MKPERKFSIKRPKPGVLIYREGGTEYRFPIYEEDGETVFVACATGKRIYLQFLRGDWADVPTEFGKTDRERVTANVVEHFGGEGARLRVMTRAEPEQLGFQFHPELFDYKTKAAKVLDAAGFAWFSDYDSIDLLHEEFGLEVCGIQKDESVQPIVRAMRHAFPHWHYSVAFHKCCGREVGWKFKHHMFPRHGREGRWVDAE